MTDLLSYTVVVEPSKGSVGSELEQNPELLRHVQVCLDDTQSSQRSVSLKYVEEHGSDALNKRIQDQLVSL